MAHNLNRKNCNLKYSKWFHHVGMLRVVSKKTGNKELRMIAHGSTFYGTNDHDWYTLTDSNIKDVFIWLGRYLALKGKLPRHLRLEEIAITARRTSMEIREIVATEHFQLEILRNNQEQR